MFGFYLSPKLDLVHFNIDFNETKYTVPFDLSKKKVLDYFAS